MGDRVSISFSNSWAGMGEKGEDRITSPALFSHWNGMDFVNYAYAYVRKLKKERKGSHSMPLDRLEPGTVMVDFIREFTKNMKAVDSNFYLGKDEMDGDNSDNGHHEIRLDEVR
jgi:hypothetical protein